jgi:hypothetical protein
MEHKNVHYGESSLQICLPCACPEATHQALILGIVSSVRFQMECPAATRQDAKEGSVSLLNLLESLLPDERQLSKAFQP